MPIAAASSGDSLSAAPGVAVGVLLILAAILWFNAYARYKFKKLVGWLVVGAIAAVLFFGYILNAVVRPFLDGGA